MLLVYPLLPAKTFEVVQGAVAELMKDRILIGHAIQNHLKARFTLFLLAYGAQFLPLMLSCSHIHDRLKILMHFYSLDIGFKNSSYLTETLLDPEFGHACKPNKTAFNKAYNVNEDLWSWFERLDNRLNLVRFGEVQEIDRRRTYQYGAWRAVIHTLFARKGVCIQFLFEVRFRPA